MNTPRTLLHFFGLPLNGVMTDEAILGLLDKLEAVSGVQTKSAFINRHKAEEGEHGEVHLLGMLFETEEQRAEFVGCEKAKAEYFNFAALAMTDNGNDVYQ